MGESPGYAAIVEAASRIVQMQGGEESRRPDSELLHAASDFLIGEFKLWGEADLGGEPEEPDAS